ncbi:alpha-ketoglutarate decarboxylase [mine drainage metagenome]|uniref:Alpha-ketoglutarate decarboxylase n=1 Tax=mine drainage metagenome TaxID=410659 RepID=T1C0Q9_9ZZZZ
MLHDQDSMQQFIPLQHLAERQPSVQIIDSVLSEEAVLGFEYGYSTTEPACLTIWEAQFGDFANGAQVIIDQFISSGEAKWERYCGLVLFLPHGYEGQGPEHSSARLERFLQLCAESNMQVCVPSTPAQMFHMLRRQMLQNFRKPLIVMTPKSLLRHDLSVSALEDLAGGAFARVIDEVDEITAGEVRRAVFCSGKVYFDLLKARRNSGIRDVALVRIEQLYPFPSDEYHSALARYRNLREVVWCQEEPQNQGAWYQIRHRLRRAAQAGRGAAVCRARPGGRARDRHRPGACARAADAGGRGAAFNDDRELRPQDSAPDLGRPGPWTQDGRDADEKELLTNDNRNQSPAAPGVHHGRHARGVAQAAR